MYLTPTDKHWIIDIETDGLRDECTQIFVVCVENARTDEKHHFTDKTAFLEWLPSDALLVGHNSISFDVPVLNRLWGARIGISRVVDTFVLSMLYSPSLLGGHSLEAWGQRLRLPKLEHKDFTQYSEEMLSYCQNDVAVTKRLLLRLTSRMRQIGFTEKGAEIETLSWHIIQNKQRRHGFPFDYKKAHELYTELRAREEELKNEIYKHWPPEFREVRRYSRAHCKDGAPTANFKRHQSQFPKLVVNPDGSYSAFDWVEFNLGSPPQRVAKLLEAGWEPRVFTKKTAKGGGGNPKVDEESLGAFAESSGNEGARALAKWVVINSRANMVRTWMDAYNEETGAIHGNLWLAGSLRYRHDNPNSANIPSVRVSEENEILLGERGSWTYESRNLWTCGDQSKYSLIGIDAKGIQLRVLAHYLNDKEFSKAILAEDPHMYNAKVWGFGEDAAGRRKAKTIVYAITMGAGIDRIASEAKISTKEAREVKKLFFDRVPTVPKLISKLRSECRRTGRIRLCDGTPILVPEEYRVIPYLLQGDESRIMKQASIYLDEEIRRHKLDARKVGDIHDEWQFVVGRRDIESFIERALEAFPRTGRTFGYRVPIEGDAKVGKTWAETH